MQLLINGLLEFCETLHSCSTLPADVHEGYSCSTQPADVHEGIPLLSKIPKFEHHSIASRGYHSVRSLTVLVIFYISLILDNCVRKNSLKLPSEKP